MEHQRGHVSSTFFHRALINPDIVHLPPHDFLPESGRERVSSPDFWLEIRAGAGKTRKREANPGKLDRERGCCTPDLPSANAGCGDTPRFSIIYRLKPRKIAPAFKIIPNLFLRSPPTVETTSPRMLAFRFIVENEIDSFFSNLFEISNII